MTWTKDQPCICCGNEPVIVHHPEGSTFKLKVDLVTVMLGGWYVLPLCRQCDDLVTQGSRRRITDRYGPQSALWIVHYSSYMPQDCPVEVVKGIRGHGR